jgi:thioredoxin-like negative regulator of GroEL
LANEPDSAKAHFRLGKALAGTDDLDEAKKELEQVMRDTRHDTQRRTTHDMH